MESKTIYEKLRDDPNLRTFLLAAEKTGISGWLKGKKLFTVFAPNDNAYAKIPHSTLAEIMKEPSKLYDLTSYHLAAGKILFKDLEKPLVVQSIQGENLSLNSEKFFTVNNVRVVKPDVECVNSVIHVIYKVLDPYERV